MRVAAVADRVQDLVEADHVATIADSLGHIVLPEGDGRIVGRVEHSVTERVVLGHVLRAVDENRVARHIMDGVVRNHVLLAVHRHARADHVVQARAIEVVVVRHVPAADQDDAVAARRVDVVPGEAAARADVAAQERPVTGMDGRPRASGLEPTIADAFLGIAEETGIDPDAADVGHGVACDLAGLGAFQSDRILLGEGQPEAGEAEMVHWLGRRSGNLDEVLDDRHQHVPVADLAVGRIEVQLAGRLVDEPFAGRVECAQHILDEVAVGFVDRARHRIPKPDVAELRVDVRDGDDIVVPAVVGEEVHLCLRNVAPGAHGKLVSVIVERRPVQVRGGVDVQQASGVRAGRIEIGMPGEDLPLAAEEELMEPKRRETLVRQRRRQDSVAVLAPAADRLGADQLHYFARMARKVTGHSAVPESSAVNVSVSLRTYVPARTSTVTGW